MTLDVKNSDIAEVLEYTCANKSHTADKLGVSRQMLNYRIGQDKDLQKIVDKYKAEPTQEFEIDQPVTSELSLEEILERKKAKFQKKEEHYDSKDIVDIDIKLNGPIAVSCFGDPHLDDDGCDIELVTKHLDIVSGTEGMFAINIGDITNNWVGFLKGKYADQSTTISESWKLAEWMIKRLPWLAIIAGNHDLWHDGHDPLKWICSHANQPYINHGVRMRLNFPNGKEVVINAAHDFTGHSQFNSVHGGMKKAMRWHDDLYFCGHKHNTAIGTVVDPKTGKLCWVARCDSYKRFDSYCEKLGIDDTFVSPCVTAIINPYAKSNRDLIIIHTSVEQAAKHLTFLREDFKDG